MKKILLRILIALIVLIVLAILAASLFLDTAARQTIQTVGSRITKVDVKLDAVSLSILGGSAKIKGLVVGNPPNFKTPQAIKVGSASVALEPRTLLADKLVIKSIAIDSPDVTFEGGLKGNNLGAIRANVEQATSSGETNATPKAAKKLEVDDFLITGAKLNVSLSGITGGSTTVTLPTIHLTNLGTGPDGITAADLTKKVLGAIEQEAVKAAGSAVTGLGKGATNLGKTGEGGVSNVTRAIGNLFKKK